MITQLLFGVLLYKDSWDGDSSSSIGGKLMSLLIFIIIGVIVVLFMKFSGNDDE